MAARRVESREGHAVLEDAFKRALGSAAQISESYYVFAGRVAQIRIIGNHLATETDRPFAHLRLLQCSSKSPTLTVDIWEEATTGVECPLTPPTRDRTAPGTIEASAYSRFVHYQRAGTQFSLDRARQHIVGCVASSHRLTQFERGRPFMGPLHLWHQDRDVHAIHAGFVARNGCGVLFGGAGGSGKTTSALMCLQAGFTFLSDDYVGLETRDGRGAVGHSVYCSTHVEPKHLQSFDFLIPHARPGTLSIEDKSLIFLSDVVSDRLGRAAEIAVIVLPQKSHGERTMFRPATKAEALFRLAPSSVFIQRASIKGRRALDKLAELVSDTPTYWLDWGSDPTHIPDKVSELLDEVAP